MSRSHLLQISSLIAILVAGQACAVDAVSDTASTASPEQWNPANDPSRVDADFNYKLDQLPRAGAAERTPHAGHWWPTSEDSINARWDGPGSASAAEKFGRAFGKTGVELAVSQDAGIRGQTRLRECRSQFECWWGGDGSVCAIPRGARSGRCVPEWWGICHGWAHQAIREPAAKRPVTKNGVTFYPADIDALMSLVYSRGLPTKFLSQRCNKNGRGLATDASGRLADSECRDMNPGSFHVVLTNLLGVRKQGFVLDVNYDEQVWNHPARDFSVERLEEVDQRRAMSLLGQRGSQYRFNPNAKRFYYVGTKLRIVVGAPPSRTTPNPDQYTKELRLEYVLETDADAKVLGGEWVGRSQTFHPDFAWWATGNPTGKSTARPNGIANGLITYEEVKSLLDAAGG
jgi:hypothetical protein